MTLTSAGTFTTTTNVNMRSEPSTSANVMSVVSVGTNVNVLEHDSAGWSRVQLGDSTGFIRSDFLIRGYTTGGIVTDSSASDTVIATLLTTGAVNMRSGSSTNTSIIRTLASNTSVEVLENQANGWSRVRHNGTNGFIRSDLLSATGAPAATTALRTTAAVNFRTGPSTNDRVIRTLAASTSVSVLENQANGWSRVTVNGTSGFIRSDLLSATGAPAATTLLRTTAAVNFRVGPSTNDRVIRTLAANTSVSVLESQANGWSRVTVNGTSGFIRSDLLSATGAPAATTALRTTAAVNLRAGPSTNDRVIRTLAANTSVSVLESQANGWSRVRHNGTDGFIRSDLLSTGTTSNSNRSLGQQIADFARGFEGHRYVWGGASPAAGFDCSGLVTYVLRNFGINVSRTASQQFRNNGVAVTQSELAPGDLVFFSNNGATVTHVGIYLGGDRFVHASGSRVGVIISTLSARPLFGARRVV